MTIPRATGKAVSAGARLAQLGFRSSSSATVSATASRESTFLGRFGSAARPCAAHRSPLRSRASSRAQPIVRRRPPASPAPRSFRPISNSVLLHRRLEPRVRTTRIFACSEPEHRGDRRAAPLHRSRRARTRARPWSAVWPSGSRSRHRAPPARGLRHIGVELPQRRGRLGRLARQAFHHVAPWCGGSPVKHLVRIAPTNRCRRARRSLCPPPARAPCTRACRMAIPAGQPRGAFGRPCPAWRCRSRAP